MGRPRIKLEGKVFERLTVLKLSHSNARKHPYYLCQCSCGNLTTVRGSHLTDNSTKSCGCYIKDYLKEHPTNITHCFSGKNKGKFYNTWLNIKNRTLNKNNPRYYDYGGKGRTLCKRWHQFENFRDDMYKEFIEHIKKHGEKNTSIDRINNQGNYTPKNCRWATWEIQYKNK